MKQINEVSRRSMYHEDNGFACGPASSVAIIAEIVLDIAGKQVFLYGEWVDISGDYFFEANSESLFDASEKLFNAESEDEEQASIDERERISAGKIQDDSIYEPYYEELKQMIHDEMKAHGLEDFCEDEDEEEDE